jgi:RND family efflux transporter MFP subunit
MNDVPHQPRRHPWLRLVGTAIVCLAILGASAAAIVVINQTEPTAQQGGATRKSAALVETIAVRRGTYQPNLVVLGTVEAAQELVLSPRVSGQVIELSPSFVPGGTVRQGELLLRIDPADFENAVAIRQSELEQSRASLEIERGRQTLAEKELALLEGTITEMNRALVLREPQIESILAEVKAAEAAVERAKLDLERTQIYAPFDAQILRRSVNVGSQVAPGSELAQLVGIQEYWIMAAVPVRSLRWIQFPETDGKGSSVTLRNVGKWPEGAVRHANVTRMIGTLDRQTRLARVLITVDDPLAQKKDAPPLILDTLLEACILGRPIEDVVRLSREYVRERDTVWIMKDGKLEIRDTEIIFEDAEFAYIRHGLDEGEQVVITTLATVADGIGLREANELASQPENRVREEAD